MVEKTQRNVFVKEPQEKKKEEVVKYLTQHYEESDFVVGKAYHSRTEAEIEEITHYCKEALATKSTNRERNDFISDIMIK